MPATAEIDRVLSTAAETKKVAGVTAAAATADGTLYEGAFGLRGLPDGAPMTFDTVFRIASMTKAVTAVAAMQMVEQGKLALEQPAGEIVPELAAPKVLEGFDAAGKPMLRPAKRPVTLRNLLTHTSGFVYDNWDANMFRYGQVTGLPAPRTGRIAALQAPLAYEPDERWEYGIGIDWAGRMVEAVSGETLDAYMRAHIFAPLGMHDTGYEITDSQEARLAQVHTRQTDGSLRPLALDRPTRPEHFFGGGGLYSTARDYLTFLQMLLHGGTLNGNTVLQSATVALMGQNHINALLVEPLKTMNPQTSNDAEFFPGMPKKWGLSFLINTQDALTGRSAGSLAWAGINNTYYWLDPKKRVAGVIMTQVLPFADPTVLSLLDEFETAVYRSLA
jgi:methyl acetate hydrolase